jgi:hypothetical protein
MAIVQIKGCCVFRIVGKSSTKRIEVKVGILESDVEDKADIGHVGASQVFKNGYQV